jgi:hypothetical protein
VIALAREVLGTIDVDPASCAEAQKTVQATTYYTIEDGGLRHPWYGNVWLNPLFGDPAMSQWVGKLLEELKAGRTTAAILLGNSCTEVRWFDRASQHAQRVCFPYGRMKFIHRTGTETGNVQGQAIFYFGPHPERFDEVLSAVGHVWQLSRARGTGPQLDLPQAQAAPPPFDPKKYYVGNVCKHGHVYAAATQPDGQPGSLRHYISGLCVACEDEKRAATATDNRR